MPELGEVRLGSELGKESPCSKFMWAECPGCKRQRWVLMRGRYNRSNWDPDKFPCRDCSAGLYSQGKYDAVNGWKESVKKKKL